MVVPLNRLIEGLWGGVNKLLMGVIVNSGYLVKGICTYGKYEESKKRCSVHLNISIYLYKIM